MLWMAVRTLAACGAGEETRASSRCCAACSRLGGHGEMGKERRRKEIRYECAYLDQLCVSIAIIWRAPVAITWVLPIQIDSVKPVLAQKSDRRSDKVGPELGRGHQFGESDVAVVLGRTEWLADNQMLAWPAAEEQGAQLTWLSPRSSRPQRSASSAACCAP